MNLLSLNDENGIISDEKPMSVQEVLAGTHVYRHIYTHVFSFIALIRVRYECEKKK